MYYDLLIRLKNAQAAKKKSLKMPYSKTDMAIAELLAARNYLKSVSRKGRGVKRVIELTLTDTPAIHGLRLVSTPSRAIYAGYKDLRSVKSGYGTLVLTTPQGILAGDQARKRNVGGKILFEIW